MEAARPRSSRRRLRRERLARPVDGRLVRVTLLLLVPALALLVVTIGRPGALPSQPLPPAFDGRAALALVEELVRDYPNRTPGTSGAVGAARWVEATLALYGLPVATDAWREDVPGLGPVELRNLTAVVPGETPEMIVVVAHRDNSGDGGGANDNASGTAALVELARAYGRSSSAGVRARPRHTLVFLSSDGGDYGALGSRRFAATPEAARSLAAVSLDALGARGAPRLALDGAGGRSPSPTLVHTARQHVREQTGREAALPGLARQLVDLGIPFGHGEQAPLLGRHVSAIRLTTVPDAAVSGRDDLEDLAPLRFEQLGRAAQALLGSLDESGELAASTDPGVHVGERVLRGWALALLFAVAVAPPFVAVADLAARLRRQGLRLGPAFRCMRSRLAVWLWAGALVWVGARLGLLPEGPVPPLPAAGLTTDAWEPAGVVALALLGVVGWLLARRRLTPRRPAAAGEELAGLAAGLVVLVALAAVLALAQPLALVFVLPSLYTWIWLPQVGPSWRRDVLYGVGLAGPVLGLVSLAERFDLGLEVVPYAIGLVSSGSVPTVAVLAGLAWCAAAAQLGAVAASRYAPYADGALRPPPGVVRTSLTRTAATLQSRRR